VDTSGLVAFVSPPPAVRLLSTSAEGPAAQAPEVWLRDYDGEHQRRIAPEVAARLVSDGIADRVSAAGHIRLKLGIRWSLNSLSPKSPSTLTTVGRRRTGRANKDHNSACENWTPQPQASGHTPKETAGGPQGFASYPIFGLAGLRKTAAFAEGMKDQSRGCEPAQKAQFLSNGPRGK
jgi:hypothetical protein